MGLQLLTERRSEQIAGVLSCYDRMLIQGTLPGLCYAEGMTGYLYAHHVRIFDYALWAQPLREPNAPRILPRPLFIPPGRPPPGYDTPAIDATAPDCKRRSNCPILAAPPPPSRSPSGKLPHISPNATAAPRTHWPKLSTTLHGDPADTNFEVIHPYHPRRGQKFKLITYRRNWGEDRVYFHDAGGRLCSIPAAWTTAVAADPFVTVYFTERHSRSTNTLAKVVNYTAWRPCRYQL